MPRGNSESAQIDGDRPSTEFLLHRFVARFQFGHEPHELPAGANVGKVWVAGEQRIVGHARFHGLAQPSYSLAALDRGNGRSEEHTSELQSHSDLVCRLLLEKKKIRS